MHTRFCAQCEERKTIRGIWYLVGGLRGDQAFLCESCFSVSAARPTRFGALANGLPPPVLDARESGPHGARDGPFHA